jgi:hypothetical protein
MDDFLFSSTALQSQLMQAAVLATNIVALLLALAGNVANMLATCLPDTGFCSKFGRMGPCRRHRVDDVGTCLCRLVPTSRFPALFCAC